MKAPFLSKNTRTVRWQQRGIERLLRALHYLQRLLAVDRPPEAMKLIPIHATQSHVERRRQQRTWRA